MSTIHGESSNRKVERKSIKDPSGNQIELFIPFEGVALPDGTTKWHKNSDFSIRTEEQAQDWVNCC